MVFPQHLHSTYLNIKPQNGWSNPKMERNDAGPPQSQSRRSDKINQWGFNQIVTPKNCD